MTYIDTHTHLHFEQFATDREAVLERACAAGVRAIITLGTGVSSSQYSLSIAHQHAEVFAGVGIHPSEAHRASADDWKVIQKLAQTEKKVVAIGEIGLDFYWKNVPAEAQYSVFRSMLKLAADLHLPVVIHSRSAIREMEWFLQEERIHLLRGVMHCFEGDTTDARFFLDLGMHISFTGNITYKNFLRLDVVRFVPLDRLLLETDSPFLPPVPYRGKRNEPAFLPLIAKKIAKIHKTSLEQVAQQTTQNAIQLFQLPLTFR